MTAQKKRFALTLLVLCFLGCLAAPACKFSQTITRTAKNGFDPSKLEMHETGSHDQLEDGRKGSTYRIHYQHNGEDISPWHDIPLESSASVPGDRIYHFLCEIPKGTTRKMEVNKVHPRNPVAQDHKKGKLRFYKYHPEVGSICNYGAIMQTWEDPEHVHPDTAAGGDNDPVDVLQIDADPCIPGEVQEVRVLGTLAMVDDGETDWKLIVTNRNGPDIENFKDIHDVPKEKVNELREWFRNYKTAEGKGLNKFGLDEKAMPRHYAEDVVWDTHQQWLKLISGERTCSDKKDKCAVQKTDFSNAKQEL